MMLCAAKCYWPGVRASTVEEAGARARHAAAGEGSDVSYLGAIVFPDDELVLCMFDAESHAAVKRASESVGIPCERVMTAQWLE